MKNDLTQIKQNVRQLEYNLISTRVIPSGEDKFFSNILPLKSVEDVNNLETTLSTEEEKVKTLVSYGIKK